MLILIAPKVMMASLEMTCQVDGDVDVDVAVPETHAPI